MSNNITPAKCGQAICGQTICGQTVLYSDSSNPAAEYGDNPRINLATGRLLYVHSEINIGANLYAIDVSHVYNSAMGNSMIAKFPGMGSGWKLNVQQYIESVNDNTYKYIDGLGYVHILTKFATSPDKYYDMSNASLVITVPTSGERYISDENGNRVYFNTAGLISKTVSGRNEAICKIFVYDTQNRLIQLYDERSRSGSRLKRYIGLTYNTSGQLATMTTYNTDSMYAADTAKKISTLKYTYIGDKLVAADKENFGTDEQPFLSKSEATFMYTAADQLCTVVDGGTNALRVTYDTHSRAYKLERGLMPEKGQYVGEKNLFAGITNSSGNSLLYIGQGVQGDFAPKSRVEIMYNSVTVGGIAYNNRTTVTNEQGIAIEHFFNIKGLITAVFQKDGSNYKTLTNDTGFSIPTQSGSGTINGDRITASGDDILINSGSFNFNRSGEDDVRHYMFTAWVKLETETENATFALFYNNNSSPHQADLDPSAYNVWQLVSVPIELYSNDKTISNIKLRIIGNGSPNTCSFRAANCRLTPAVKNALMFEVNSQGHGASYVDLDYFDRLNVNYADNSSQTLNLRNSVGFSGISYRLRRSDFYFSPSDVFACMKNMKNSPNNFDAIYCDGTRRLKGVKELTFYTNSFVQRYSLRFKPDNEAYCYFEEPFLDKKGYTRQYFYYNSDGIEIKTVIKVTSGNEKPQSETFVKTDYSGNTLYVADVNGKTVCKYDEFGCCAQIKKIKADGSTTTIYTADYSDDGEVTALSLEKADDIIQKAMYTAGKVALSQVSITPAQKLTWTQILFRILVSPFGIPITQAGLLVPGLRGIGTALDLLFPNAGVWISTLFPQLRTIAPFLAAPLADTLTLGFYQDDNKIYHVKKYCPQAFFGYNDHYDTVFGIACDKDQAKFDFTSGGKGYILWAWKGDYLNLGAGAEIGIYVDNNKTFLGTKHWDVDPDLEQKGTLTLYHKGQEIIDWEDTNWWITAFNPFCTGKRQADLTAVFTIYFNNPQDDEETRNRNRAFYNGLKTNWQNRIYSANGAYWTFYDSTYTAVLRF